MKKFLTMGLILAMCFAVAYADSDVIMSVGNNRAMIGENVAFIDSGNGDVVPVVIDGRTLVPVRFIAEAFGFSVNWEPETESVTLYGADKIISMTIGGSDMSVEKTGDVQTYTLDVPPMIMNDRTYLPLRAIAEEAMGMSVYWDGKSLIVISESNAENSEKIAKSGAIMTHPKMQLKDFPVIDGSTATNPFVVDLAKKLLGVSEEAARSVTLLSKTHKAIVNVVMGDADIVFVTHPSEAELAFAKDMGVELEIVPFSKEGFVFLNHKNNKVDNLTLEQVKSIYEGKITNWKEVGGGDNEIIPYQRPVNSGSQTNMIEFMKDRELMQPPKEQIIGEMGQLIEAVANYQNSEKSLGYSVFYFASEMYTNNNIKLLKINGVMPTAETIRSLEYPIVSNYYAVIRKSDGTDSPARKMLNWVMSSEGQAVVDSSGLVSM